MLKIFSKLLYKLGKCRRRLARKARTVYYAGLFKSCGKPLPKIGNHAKISHPAMISCGRGVVLNSLVYLDGKGGIELGDNVTVSCGGKIITGSLEIDETGTLGKHHIRKKVVIGNNVWIGTDAIILPGVTIGGNTIIGAGSVVTKDLEGGRIYAGIPARAIREISAPPGKTDAE